MTPEQILDTAVEIIGEHQLLPELSTFHFALALHTAVPRIEAAYNWYSSNVNETHLQMERCSSWVDWGGVGYCDPDSLDEAIEFNRRVV